MKTITISTENSETYSSISNFFIDYYMTDANGEFVKVYLYLARLLSSNSKITVAEIADHFNLTEKDICRAIKYWISRDVLKLNYDGRGHLSGIVLLPLHNPANDFASKETDIISFLRDDEENEEDKDVHNNQSYNKDNNGKTDSKTESKTDAEIIPMPNSKKAEDEEEKDATTPNKPSFTKADLDRLKGDDDWTDIVYQIETLFGKTLSSRDVNTLLYIYDTLEFDVDLFDYLIEYCATMGRRNCRYLEAVAIAWYKEGITTRQDAKNQSYNLSSTSKIVFKTLGMRSHVPTTLELKLIAKWTGDFCFTDEIIKSACERAVLNNSATYSYVDAILINWHKSDVHTLEDIERLDKEFNANKQKSKSNNQAPAKPAVQKNTTSFSNFQQSNTDEPLEEIEKLFLKEVNKK